MSLWAEGLARTRAFPQRSPLLADAAVGVSQRSGSSVTGPPPQGTVSGAGG